MKNNYQFTVTCATGMEELVAAELKEFGATGVVSAPGALSFSGGLEPAYRTCLWSRYSSRVLLLLASFPAKDPDQLYDGVRAIAWQDYLAPDGTLAVDCSLTNSAMTHSQYALLRVKDAVVDYFRDNFDTRPSVDVRRPDLRLNIFINKNQGFLSLDFSGQSLHRRGYRVEGGDAPLKESLAAAIVSFSGVNKSFSGSDIILDPMCGSGTLLIEAALIVGDIAPGLEHSYFGFLRWPEHDDNLWRQLIAEALGREDAGADKQWPRIIGYDADPHVVAAANKNIAKAGLVERIHVERRPLAMLEPPVKVQDGQLIMVTNPPYGERLDEVDEVKYLYRCLGRIMAHDFNAWQMAVFSSNPDLLDALGQKASKQHRLYNGSLSCRLRLSKVGDTGHEANVWEVDNAAEPTIFNNRLRKNLKKLLKWANRENIECFRVYDRDIPEYNVAIDFYGHRILIQEYQAAATVSDENVMARRREILNSLPAILGAKRSQIFVKTRKRQKGKEQYQQKDKKGKLVEAKEGGCSFLLNMTDYLDAGLFLDHRPVRMMIQATAQGKKFLNLYAYTCSATVHAAKGGAIYTTSVDASDKYLEWGRKNLALNGFDLKTNRTITADCLEWLLETKGKYDLIFVDPPTFSNRKGRRSVFDVQRDHRELLDRAMDLLALDGRLIFSTNFRKFKLAPEITESYTVQDISSKTIPLDFKRNQKIHKCFELGHRTL